ncbi:MAG TPA: bifunctional UDP-N-acetylglucosamine diphosphorylase/glucosamine-1-phosphate N-acetyltransferase GlmU [Myxococcota bacterium]|nr:bifunctional UDP-N-acetylglucosamine diphosphorylase/glucosamine-1-phosphate N-acetyltransferase GlmU [Myxococcota bacterium]
MKIASIILCAGVGSRFKSNKNKILHELCGRPLAYWSIKNAMAVTNLPPIVVISHQAQAVEEELRKHFHDAVVFAYQEVPNGTAGAVRAAIPHLDESCQSVLVICGDTPLLKTESLAQLVTIQQNSHVPIALMTAFTDDPSGYGRIIRNRSQQISGVVEEGETSPLEREIKEVNPGVYVYDVDFLRDHIFKITPSRQKSEFYLTDLIEIYYRSGASYGPVSNVEISCEEMHGINDRRQLAYAQKVLNRRLLDKWMLEGATFIDPDNTYIEERVKLSKDVVIYPGAYLSGETHVGEGVIIENGAIIKDTVIENYAHIFPYTLCDQAYVGERCKIGPFARLRPEARLENDVRVGNFVEIKRSRLKEGAKANHLAYIGDAELGANSNIGAGAITCNFDGRNKHRTVIGEGAFIGSNVTLIAPLAIGDHAFVAGGSTIDREVPEATLAIGRAHQVNKERKRKTELLSESSKKSSSAH